MAVTESGFKPATLAPSSLKTLAAACRRILGDRRPAGPPRRPAAKTRRDALRCAALQALYLSALALPGMTAVQADDAEDTDDDIGLQFSHYEESTRPIYSMLSSQTTSNNITTVNNSAGQIHNGYTPINVDSEHAYGNFHIDDRTRFGFNFDQDLWSGASPQFTAPGVNRFQTESSGLAYSQTGSGATPAFGTAYPYLVNAQHQLFYEAQTQTNSVTGQSIVKLAPVGQLTQVLGYASPEIRNQGDAKFGYDWDNASIDIGGGVSIERDYLSRFGNLGGRFYYNQKQTTFSYGLSYTNSSTHALEMPDVTYNNYATSRQQLAGDGTGTYLNGVREDWAVKLGLSQVVSKNGLLSAGFSYTNSNGFMANPYKSVLNLQLSNSQYAGYQQTLINGSVIAEKRPNLRNQFTWDTSYLHYIEALDAAPKLSYNFFHDDWGVNAHTFALEWRQNLGGGWTFTPSGRYYSQTAASFFAPYFFDITNNNQAYSSDQRLAAYGTLSGGGVLAKDFARGLKLELGFEYYTHQSALTLAGAGSGNYMDFSYYVANANLRADLGKLAKAGAASWSELFDGGMDDMAGMDGMAHMRHNAALPAGLMFAEMMPAGEVMLGYRFMQQNQGNGYQIGTQGGNNGLCGQNSPYMMCNSGMTMNMHMLNLMYAPTDWLNLMLMPQYMSMTMNMYNTPSMPPPSQGMGMGIGMRDWESNGGFGDTGMYAMLKLFEDGDHKLFTSQGLTAPTGTIRTWGELDAVTARLFPYDMQNGSGTWDYNPSLTYTGKNGAFSWGGQLGGTLRLQKQNYMHWRYGDIAQGTVWGGYQWNDWLSNTLRVLYTKQGAISDYSQNNAVTNQSLMSGGSMRMYRMPDIYPQNYGGTFVDLGLGLTVSIPRGTFAGNRLSVEWLQPMSTNYNGYQLERIGTLAIQWGYMFSL
ncbi:MAG: DUF3570 domain-containing protein [Methylococcales bacterium]|nr:DUF3570 domain-containing protein [Methylococcales bacterium]